MIYVGVAIGFIVGLATGLIIGSIALQNTENTMQDARRLVSHVRLNLETLPRRGVMVKSELKILEDVEKMLE